MGHRRKLHGYEMIYGDDNIHHGLEKIALSPALRQRARAEASKRAKALTKASKNKDLSPAEYYQLEAAAARRKAQAETFKTGKYTAPVPGEQMGAKTTKGVEAGIGIKHSPAPIPAAPAGAGGGAAADDVVAKNTALGRNLLYGAGALGAGAIGYGVAKHAHVYSDDSMHEALEKIAFPKVKIPMGEKAIAAIRRLGKNAGKPAWGRSKPSVLSQSARQDSVASSLAKPRPSGLKAWQREQRMAGVPKNWQAALGKKALPPKKV
tara:strand:+ start:46 stop:837 length:792 start_codon:yes stop_codon:yes gene_type:complete